MRHSVPTRRHSVYRHWYLQGGLAGWLDLGGHLHSENMSHAWMSVFAPLSGSW